MGPGKGFVLRPHSRGDMSESVEAANSVRMQLQWNLQSSTTAAALTLTEGRELGHQTELSWKSQCGHV